MKKTSFITLCLVSTAVWAVGSYGDFLGMLAKRESSGNQYAVNQFGYAGLYQMGTPALIDAGYKDRAGNWTGKNGITSQDAFLSNAQAQTDAVTTYQSGIQKYIKANGLDQYVGKTVGGVEITESGLIAGAHLVGQGNLKNFLKSDGSYIPRDGNKVPITEYIQKFGGYNTPEAGAVANLAASAGGAVQSLVNTVFGKAEDYSDLGKDIGNYGSTCPTETYIGLACYIKDPCNLRCSKTNAELNGAMGTVNGGEYNP